MSLKNYLLKRGDVKNDRYKLFLKLKSFASLVKAAGGVLYLDARKADGSAPLTGNDSPWVDKAKPKVTVDGYAYNGYNNSNWIFLNTGSGTGTDGTNITVAQDAAGERAKLYDMQLKPSTLYTLVYTVTIDNGANLNIIGSESDIDEGSIGLSESLGENRITFTTSSSIVFNGLSLFVTTGDITFDTFTVYEGDYVSGSPPLPTQNVIFVEGNDGTLTNFAGTGTSGWQASPNLLRFDGVDDFVSFADTASLDITTAPLAMFVTFKIAISQTKFIYHKGDSGSNPASQYGIVIASDDTFRVDLNGVTISTSSVFPLNTWINIGFIWDGVNVKRYIDLIQDGLDAPLATTLSSGGVLSIGSRVVSPFLDGDIATCTIYTGSDINKILAAEAKISAEYLALNP